MSLKIWIHLSQHYKATACQAPTWYDCLYQIKTFKDFKTTGIDTVFIDQNGQMVRSKGSIFQERCVLVNRFSEGPEEVIATNDILYLVENKSITG